jgi:hypothetical protein
MKLLLALALLALTGCATVNDLGIGGEPRLMCSFRDGHALIDDKLAGTGNVRASMVRRFEDADSLCVGLKPAQ